MKTEYNPQLCFKNNLFIRCIAMLNKTISYFFGIVFFTMFLCACDIVPPKEFVQTHPSKHGTALNLIPGSTDIFGATTTPKHVTLLLPLTGKLATSGQAISNGFLAANNYAKQHGQPSLELEFLDTNNANILDLYQKAATKPNNFIVGPLTKPDVSVIASIPNPQIPILALNTIDVEQKNTAPNVYQFGLSPQDEVIQIADRIVQDGHSKVIIIALNSPWSNILVNTFKSELEKQKGSIVEQLSYNKQTDFNSSISKLLHAEQNVAGKKSSSQISTAELNLHRRQDFDAIFLIAKPEDARQINPLLKYYYAGNIQAYATSLIYGGVPNSQQDFDLDGIIFCDLPWILQNPVFLPNYLQDTKRQIIVTFSEVAPEINKLHALGVDSYNLMRFLNKPNVFPKHGLQGATGNLFLTSSNHIYRSLLWAKIQNGQPNIIP